jgi:hypothetical protein
VVLTTDHVLSLWKIHACRKIRIVWWDIFDVSESLLLIIIAMSGHRHGCDGDHNHDETPEMGLQYSLYSKIDLRNLECLNEKCEGSGKDVFKAWEDRLDFEKVSFVCRTIYEHFHIVP